MAHICTAKLWNLLKNFAADVPQQHRGNVLPQQGKKLGYFIWCNFPKTGFACLTKGITNIDFSHSDVYYTSNNNQCIKGVPCVTEVVLEENKRKSPNGINPAKIHKWQPKLAPAPSTYTRVSPAMRSAAALCDRWRQYHPVPIMHLWGCHT